MAWVLINNLNLDSCLLINEYVSLPHISGIVNTFFGVVELELQNSILHELKGDGDICKICRWVEMARKSHILTPYIKRRLQLWREEEEYINEYDDAPDAYIVELMRWRIDCCCEY